VLRATGATPVGRGITPPPKKPNQRNREAFVGFCFASFKTENILHCPLQYIIRRKTAFVKGQNGGGEGMDEREPERITLPEEMQLDMLKFFLRTSIPRIKKEKQQAENSLSEKNSDKE